MLNIVYNKFSLIECIEISKKLKENKDENYKEALIELLPYKIENEKFIIDLNDYYKFYNNEGQLIGYLEGKINKKIGYFVINSFVSLIPGNGYGEKMIKTFSIEYGFNKYSICSSVFAIKFWSKIAIKLEREIEIDIN